MRNELIKLSIDDVNKINKTVIELEDYYYKKLEENNYRVFAWPVKTKKTKVDAEELRCLKNTFNFVFKAKSKINLNSDYISGFFTLTKLKNRYLKNTYYDVFFTININEFLEDEFYLDKLIEAFKNEIEYSILKNNKIIKSNFEYANRFFSNSVMIKSAEVDLI